MYLHKGYIVGYPDRTFRPKDGLDRGEFATIISRLAKESNLKPIYPSKEFSDVSSRDFYFEDLKYVTSLGYFQGYPDGSFKGEEKITIAEFAATISRIIDNKNLEVKEDVWYRDYIDFMNKYGLYDIYNRNTDYNSVIKREEVVHIFNKVIGIKPDRDFIDENISGMRTFTDVSKSNPYYYDIIASGNTFTFSDNWTDYLNISTLRWRIDSYKDAKSPQSFKFYINR